MSRQSKNPNRQGFINRVEDIREAENDVDEVLKAARLKRVESDRKPVNPLALVGIIGATLILCTALVLGYLSGNFIPALMGVGIVGVFGSILAIGFTG